MSVFPTRRLRLLLAVGLLIVCGAVMSPACATNPVTGERQFNLMSEEQEIQIGQQSDPEIRKQMGVYDDPELQQYVESIAMPLARNSQRPNLPWHFTVVDAPAVNAFALPGGYIYITRGLLAHLNDEAELAGVLGHEIGHVTARHAAQQYSKATGATLGTTLLQIFVPESRAFGGLADSGLGLLFLKYGRDAELQADRLGAEYAAKNGWDPEGVPDLLNTLARLDEAAETKGVPNYLSTHPAPADRVVQIQETVAQLRTQSGEQSFKTDRNQFLKHIDGLVYGDNPREGVVRGNEFLHPELRFAIRFPDGWEITNTPTQVISHLPNTQQYMLLDLLQPQTRGGTLQDVALADMQRAGFRAIEGDSQSINGINAFVGTFQGRLQNLGDVVARVAYLPVQRNVYRVIGLAPAAEYQRVNGDISASLRSFRTLNAGEAANIRPNRIDFYTVKQGETWQSIAQGPGGGNVPPAKLAIMNNFSPSEQPRAGDRVKIVVAT